MNDSLLTVEQIAARNKLVGLLLFVGWGPGLILLWARGITPSWQIFYSIIAEIIAGGLIYFGKYQRSKYGPSFIWVILLLRSLRYVLDNRISELEQNIQLYLMLVVLTAFVVFKSYGIGWFWKTGMVVAAFLAVIILAVGMGMDSNGIYTPERSPQMILQECITKVQPHTQAVDDQMFSLLATTKELEESTVFQEHKVLTDSLASISERYCEQCLLVISTLNAAVHELELHRDPPKMEIDIVRQCSQRYYYCASLQRREQSAISSLRYWYQLPAAKSDTAVIRAYRDSLEYIHTEMYLATNTAHDRARELSRY